MRAWPWALFLVLLFLPSVSAASTISIEAYTFHPARLEVEPGQEITVTNADDEAHAIKASDGSGLFVDIPAHADVTFQAPVTQGDLAYYCPYHTSVSAAGDFMKGMLVLRAISPTPTLTPTPEPLASSPSVSEAPVPITPLVVLIGLALGVVLRRR